MKEGTQKGFFGRHSKSSAWLISLAIHAILVVSAVFLVAMKFIPREEVVFLPGHYIKQPKVPVKKPSIPTPKKNVMPKNLPVPNRALPKITSMKSTAIPAITGVNVVSSFSNDSRLGDLVGPTFAPFGDNRGSGNELVGTFYDLKQTKNGEPTGVDEEACIEIINGFIGSGWNERRFEDFFQSPRHKYATCFMMPLMGADEAPKAFEVEDRVQPRYWVCLYKGSIAAPETGRYRFMGLGDDVLSVRIGKKLVLDACWHNKEKRLSKWSSDDRNNRRYPLEGEGDSYIEQNSTLVIGDWFTLRKGESINMEVLIGELPGSAFSCRLLVQQEGKEYRMVPYSGGLRPVLPVFMTAPIPEQLIGPMNIRDDVATVQGPVFGVLTNTK